MPVRRATTTLPPNKSRSGMFKWMISGHKGSKHKQEKLNNVVVNKNNNNLKQQHDDRTQENTILHISEPSDTAYNNHNDNHHTNNQQQAEQQHLQQNNGDINQNLEKCDTIIATHGLSSSVDNDAPPLPSSRPPPPPSHPPPPVPPHGQHLPQPPQQPLPPVPGHRQDENMYQQELLPQAPGTCTLPRRGMVREDPNVRFRSPSNPPPASRQPPPYSRHQPPDPLRRPRGPYQPPPPPKMDVREPRERDKQELHGCREPRDIDLRDIRNSRNLEDTRERDFRELKDPKERDSRDQWEGRNFRGSHEHRNQQDIKDARDSTHFREIRESWERRNSSVPQPHEDLTSSSLPRPSYESWAPKNNRWSVRDLDSGFDSLSTPAMENGPHSLDAPAGRNGQLVAADVPYSQSTEDLLNASRTSPVSISSTTTSTSSVSSSPVQYPTIRPAKQPCVTGSSHTHPSPHNSPHTHPSPHNSPHTHPTPHNSPHPHPSPHNSPHTHPSPHNSPHTHPPPHNSPHTHPSHTHPSQSSPHIHLSRSSPHTHPSRSSPHIHPSNSSQNTHPSRSSPHSHPSPHSSPHPTSGSPRGLSTSQYTMPVGPPRPASPDGALLSDSVYPQDTQPRYAEIPDLPETRKNEERLNHRLSRDFRDIRDNRELREGRETKRDPRDLKDTRHSSEPRNNKDARLSREFRDTSLPRDIRDNRDSRAYMEVREETFAHDGETRGFRELSVDVEEHEVLESRQERIQGRRESRLYNGERGEAAKGFISESSNLLRVRDAPSHDCRDRDADGADGLQVTEERRALHLREGGSQQDAVRRGDGCTAASSVSWMEWTQQLQAYVAWVNSQLRKRGRPLISDLRRDLQNGVVFADLIEIISGERVAGVSREVEGAAPQVARENLERILQFMAAKRIRMTHITSKEVAEGNLKSIMRIILALAAHYKPQSVKAASPHQQPETSAPRPSTQPTTHDVGVGPDAPTAASDKTPNLSANRRALVTGGGEDPGGVMGLRRHPSMTAAPATPLDSCPVYENLPRRVAPTRWAYDSLRASHKFQWSGPTDCPSGPNKGGLDESCDDPMTTSLNTSVEGDGEVSSRREASGTRNTRPAALNFWQDLTTRQDTKTPSDSHPPPPPSQPPPDDPDNPFRYHTIHRMSGRRKLPQIPGAATPSSRVTTPQEGQESPRGPGERPGGGGVGEEGSREPEGRSQNSSPATSLVRGPTMDQWSREKNPMEPWEHDNLKSVLRDLNNTRDQLLALQNLLQSTTEVESRGVCTSRSSLTTNTPTSVSTNTPTSLNPNNNSSSDTLLDYIPSSLSVDKESPTKVTHRESHKKYNGKESPTKICREKESPSKTCREKESPSKTCREKESPSKTCREKESPSKTCREKESPSKTCREKESPSKTCHGKESPIRKCRLKDISIKTCRGADSCIKTCQDRESPVRTCYDQDIHIRTWQGMDIPTKTPHSKDKSPKDAHNRDDCNRDFLRKSSKDSSGNHRSHKRHSRQEVETTSSRVGQTLHPSELVEATTASVKQELLHLSLARQALEADKLELTRLLEQREGIITELRKQMYQRDKTIQAQRAQYEEVIKNVQNGKRVVGGECPAGGRSAVSSATKEELQLVRDAIVSLRSNFRETDPNQHTLDTLEQAIAILIERGSNGGNGGSGGSSDKASRPGDKRPSVNGVGEPCTKVIYFTERTVTPFMSTINKRLGEIRLRDFKNMFDRPGLFRFHFKSYDPEYGLVKEEIVYEDDILPGVDGKIIAWVEEDID
ncbi:uncharacterized protein [Cherax quadricarinatus]|uniref:uncharacterized protein isoform X2 n=1 Tax=Cherax quadricarinatus TaxID=27406 RepID=UPI00387E37E3